MRRGPDTFEVTITSPTVGLVTRLPQSQPDKRAAAAASNVRFDLGVARNAEGYGKAVVTPPLTAEPTLLFQGRVQGSGGTPVEPVIVGTTNKLWSVLRLPLGFVPALLKTYLFNPVNVQSGPPDMATYFGAGEIWKLWGITNTSTEAVELASVVLAIGQAAVDISSQVNSVSGLETITGVLETVSGSGVTSGMFDYKVNGVYRATSVLDREINCGEYTQPEGFNYCAVPETLAAVNLEWQFNYSWG